MKSNFWSKNMQNKTKNLPKRCEMPQLFKSVTFLGVRWNPPKNWLNGLRHKFKSWYFHIHLYTKQPTKKNNPSIICCFHTGCRGHCLLGSYLVSVSSPVNGCSDGISFKKVILRTELKRCVQYHELRTTDWCFLWGFVQSNLSKPCSILNISLLMRASVRVRLWWGVGWNRKGEYIKCYSM